ncbi:MAG: membrane protein insertase YidC [Alphaproteobacteria bacterium]|nr:membrane protein insertase YidC [Alphaproteobacteria bacterium]
MTDQRNLIIAIGASLIILLGFQYFFEMPRQREQQALEQQAEIADQARQLESSRPTPAAPGSDTPAATVTAVTQPQNREAVVENAPRVRIDSPRLSGSISLAGARIDDITLKGYHVNPDRSSPNITLLTPLGLPKPYYTEFGWVAQGEGIKVPGGNAVWQADREVLSPDQPVTLSWDNGEGLRFEQVISLDQDYMFSVTQRVVNQTGNAVSLHNYGLASRGGTPKTAGFFILHEGPVGVLDGTLREVKYDDLKEDGKSVEYDSTGGWIGITDKYWPVALVPDQQTPVKGRFLHAMRNNDDRYQVDFLGNGSQVAPGATLEQTSRVFVGAKEVRLLDRYEEQHGITNFDLAIDFGWFYFLTKPIFYAIDWLYHLLGNFGLAILALTVGIKLLFFPLANKSYRAMSKLKELQPKMVALREKVGDDRQRLNQEMMTLYKKEKVNPAAGCLPILVQIPVFFALYKVLFVTIEMRHAPFYGWIKDLSAPDPTTIFNLFGVIPWDPPTFLMIGVWPIIMGISMFLQQKLNPQPADPIQAKVFMFLPIVFTIMLASFPAGLVIYWAWNNTLSMAQQYVIMRRMGVKVGGGSDKPAAPSAKVQAKAEATKAKAQKQKKS